MGMKMISILAFVLAGALPCHAVAGEPQGTAGRPRKIGESKGHPIFEGVNWDDCSKDKAVFENLNNSGKAFFRASATARRRHAGTPYACFLSADRRVDEIDPEGYYHFSPEGGMEPHAQLYQSPPASFYRYVKDCESDQTISRQVISTANGYENFVGGSRKQRQCYRDGSFDAYYLETQEKLE